MTQPSVLVFGSTGAIGNTCTRKFAEEGFAVATASRTRNRTGPHALAVDWDSQLMGAPFDAVVWAQGANASGGIVESSATDLDELFRANVGFVADTARVLISTGMLASRCRFVVVSSVWQDFARKQKFAYIVSKSAVAGLVRSMASDLAPQGISVNAVLPGVIETPMTRKNLSDTQIANIVAQTPLRRLVSLTEVANAIFWLAHPAASGITGQFVTVDGGWSAHRDV